MIRKTRKMMLTTATFFHALLTLSRRPALQDWQSKQSLFGALSQLWQSGFGCVPAVLVQFVALTYVNWHCSEGLQQPDCNTKQKYSLVSCSCKKKQNSHKGKVESFC